MKISKSKQELARIISENGGWRDGEFAAQDGYETFAVWFFAAKPVRVRGAWVTNSDSCQREIDDVAKIPNWHQTILSRAEYFHLYPTPDAGGWIEWKGGDCPVRFGALIDVMYRDGHVQLGCRAESRCDTELYATTHWGNSGGASDIIAYRLHTKQDKPELCESVMRSIPEPDAGVDITVENKTTCHISVTDKPTIEQLAADYRNAKDCAERKQLEADAAMSEAGAALELLYQAGLEIGLDIAIASDDIEPELVITDWRDLRDGDVIRCVGDTWNAGFEDSEAVVTGIESHDYKYEHRIRACIGKESDWGADFHFIRRP